MVGMRILVLSLVLAVGCGVDQPMSSDVVLSLPAFAPTLDGWACPYPGQFGDRVLEIHAQVLCCAVSSAIMLCAESTDVQAETNHATVEVCTWTPCAPGDIVDLVTPTSFEHDERTPVSVLVTSTTSRIGDYSVISASARVQPGVTW